MHGLVRRVLYTNITSRLERDSITLLSVVSSTLLLTCPVLSMFIFASLMETFWRSSMRTRCRALPNPLDGISHRTYLQTNENNSVITYTDHVYSVSTVVIFLIRYKNARTINRACTRWEGLTSRTYSSSKHTMQRKGSRCAQMPRWHDCISRAHIAHKASQFFIEIRHELASSRLRHTQRHTPSP